MGITRPCTKHNYLVKKIEDLARTIHEAFHVAKSGRPGPVVVDLPKDVMTALGEYLPPAKARHRSYNPQVKGDLSKIEQAVELLANAKKPSDLCRRWRDQRGAGGVAAADQSG